jgi:hypothetical protein
MDQLDRLSLFLIKPDFSHILNAGIIVLNFYGYVWKFSVAVSRAWPAFARMRDVGNACIYITQILTRWGKVNLEKVTDSRLVKFLTFYGTQVSLPRCQEPPTFRYPESDQSSP